jgi:hypothetical protein
MRKYKTLFEGWEKEDLYVIQDAVETREGMKLRVFAQLKVSGGLKQLISWPRGREVAPLTEKEIRNAVSGVGYTSTRPFRPGEPCDGTRDDCVWACLIDAFKRSGENIEAFLREVQREKQPVGGKGQDSAGNQGMNEEIDIAGIQKKAGWEGVEYPDRWTGEEVKKLVESLRAMNYRTEASVLQGQGYHQRRERNWENEVCWTERLRQDRESKLQEGRVGVEHH